MLVIEMWNKRRREIENSECLSTVSTRNQWSIVQKARYNCWVGVNNS